VREPDDHDGLGPTIGRVAGGATDKDTLSQLARLVSKSAQAAGATAVASGKWLTEQLIEAAPHIPVRDLETIRRHHHGVSGPALAGELIRNAVLASAGVGAAAGALISLEEFSPATWIVIPFELLVETLAVAAIELKLVAELHEVYEQPIAGSPSQKASTIVRAWAERRGVTPAMVMRKGGLADALGRGTRNELVRLVRRRLRARLGRNVSSMLPLFVGVVAGAEINRRATRSLGEEIVRDLADS
jgi:hypothetical protein